MLRPVLATSLGPVAWPPSSWLAIDGNPVMILDCLQWKLILVT